MKTNYTGQKILKDNETIYVGEPSIDLTLTSGTHKFYACSGSITITSASVVVHLEQCQSLQINNAVGAKTYRGNYGLGDIFMSTNADSPSSRFGGSWQQIVDDVYLKITTSGAGSTGGTSNQHKIPLQSMPEHHGHTLPYTQADLCFDNDPTCPQAYFIPLGFAESHFAKNARGGFYRVGGNEVAPANRALGNNNEYYPYYYGVYLWKRVSHQNRE